MPSIPINPKDVDTAFAEMEETYEMLVDQKEKLGDNDHVPDGDYILKLVSASLGSSENKETGELRYKVMRIFTVVQGDFQYVDVIDNLSLHHKFPLNNLIKWIAFMGKKPPTKPNFGGKLIQLCKELTLEKPIHTGKVTTNTGGFYNVTPKPTEIDTKNGPELRNLLKYAEEEVEPETEKPTVPAAAAAVAVETKARKPRKSRKKKVVEADTGPGGDGMPSSNEDRVHTGVGNPENPPLPVEEQVVEEENSDEVLRLKLVEFTKKPSVSYPDDQTIFEENEFSDDISIEEIVKVLDSYEFTKEDITKEDKILFGTVGLQSLVPK